MNIERERAAFEWWASDEGESPRATERVGGCYKLAQIQSYWMAWQARAVLQSPEVQALRRDKERLDLIETQFGADIVCFDNGAWEVSLGTLMYGEGDSLRSAIDAAMEQQR